jgi:hypothetical protein
MMRGQEAIPARFCCAGRFSRKKRSICADVPIVSYRELMNIVRARKVLILVTCAQTFGAAFSQAQSPNVIGSWRVEITFRNGENRSLRFEARSSGKGSFRLFLPRPISVEPAQPSAGEWTQNDDRSVVFSGPVQFPLGNVGIDRGTLILKGKFGTDGTITGEAMFFPLGQDPKDPKATPSKSGSFKANRVSAD